jgi:desulfoferrodoxin (superoxide reductase-like protein)
MNSYRSRGRTVRHHGRKIYTFTAHHKWWIDYDVENKSGRDWQAASYLQFLRQQPHVERSMFNVETYAFMGPAIYDGKAYRKFLKPGDAPEAAFEVVAEGVTAREYCNVHGLWKGSGPC